MAIIVYNLYPRLQSGALKVWFDRGKYGVVDVNEFVSQMQAKSLSASAFLFTCICFGTDLINKQWVTPGMGHDNILARVLRLKDRLDSQWTQDRGVMEKMLQSVARASE